MNMTIFKKWLCILACIVLLAATALMATGCTDQQAPPKSQIVYTDGSDLGQGETTFALTVVDQDGQEIHFTVHTDADTVGEALSEVALIDGDMGEYGLYIKSVNGITADYDSDGVYWAFYIDGEYALTGVDDTPVTNGGDYALRVEK